MLKKLTVLVLLLNSAPALASYVKTCILRGAIVSEPVRSKAGVWEFDFAIQESGRARGERSDGSCQGSEEQIKVALTLRDRKQTLAKGQVLWLRDFFKDNRGSPSMHDFSLLSESQGKKAMDSGK